MEQLFQDIYAKNDEIKAYYRQYSGLADKLLYQLTYGYVDNENEYPDFITALPPRPPAASAVQRFCLTAWLR